MKFLGKNIQFLRKKEGKNQREFGRLLKKGQTTIANWENGVNDPGIRELCFLRDHFGIATDLLLYTDLGAVAEVKPYDLTNLPVSIAREDVQMAYLLEEVRILRQDIDEIRSKQEGSQ